MFSEDTLQAVGSFYLMREVKRSHKEVNECKMEGSGESMTINFVLRCMTC